MTHSKIQRIKLFVFLLIFLLSQITVCDGNFREKRQEADKHNKSKDNIRSDIKEPIDGISVPKNELNLSRAQIPNISGNTSVNITSKSALGTVTTISSIHTTQTSNGVHIPSINSGALMRGIFVIIGLSVLVMAYMVFRSFRLSKTRNQMVRKYGVLAHRQDVEMRPLPLDEDDDDDTTVFDASIIPSHRLQSQDT